MSRTCSRQGKDGTVGEPEGTKSLGMIILKPILKKNIEDVNWINPPQDRGL
jgi:hypothetical protein